jgi:hypothetical protein
MRTINVIKQLTILVISANFAGHLSAQSAFLNLNFELASPMAVPGDDPGFVTTASALPYWTATFEGSQQSVISFDAPATGSPWVSVVGPGTHFGFSPLDGNYSVLLQGTGFDASISQTGLIPAGTQSLDFDAEGQPGLVPLNVLIGSDLVSYQAIASPGTYTTYAANISQWAGQTVDLTFDAPPNSINWELDDITFSTQAVLEPNTLELALTGATLVGLQKCGRRAKRLIK